MEIFRFTRGSTPLLVSIPHCGTFVPEEIGRRLSPTVASLPDTDWHVDRLYDFAAGLGVSVIAATHSRYVIDLNRPPDDRPLYPGAASTGLCPTITFADQTIYAAGDSPDGVEVAQRTEVFWKPYHDRLDETLRGLKARHGIALLFDAHSIRSQVPRFFDGQLPDFNLGTGDGTAADADLTERLVGICRSNGNFSHVLNGRFKGGYITRAYGRPANDIHAVQLELSQATYMNEDPPYTYVPERADRVRPILHALLGEMLNWASDQRSRRD